MLTPAMRATKFSEPLAKSRQHLRVRASMQAMSNRDQALHQELKVVEWDRKSAARARIICMGDPQSTAVNPRFCRLFRELTPDTHALGSGGHRATRLADAGRSPSLNE